MKVNNNIAFLWNRIPAADIGRGYCTMSNINYNLNINSFIVQSGYTRYRRL